MVLDVGKKMLEKLGFTVHTAINGQGALDKICSQNTDFCAAVLDISMPEMNGIEAMQAIRKINSALPIILSSGYSEDDFPFKEEQERRPDGFLGKPFQLSEMRSSLEKLLS
jgi:CheY-like chemotaxis protein